ncbi:hypothetical protein WJX84_003601 [Apatococcus fuscideae]|uniref:Nudix hydrolase domain-containing protein n=1 Tax=Apatococcus fuscideae TaxID=2026836 RepID=A0AAW1T340_9CHLO
MGSLKQFISCLNILQEADLKPVSRRAAAVLMLLEEVHGEIHIVLTQRSSKVSTHQGEVCLPGGKRDADDTSNVATALREAREEIGLDAANVRVIGCLQPFLSKHLLSVTPVVAVLVGMQPFQPNAAEVATVFWIRLAAVLEDHPRHTWKDISWEQPGDESASWHRVHYFDIDQQNVWGLSAAMLIELAEQGYQRPAAFQVNMPGAQPFHTLTFEDGRLRWRADDTSRHGHVVPV